MPLFARIKPAWRRAGLAFSLAMLVCAWPVVALAQTAVTSNVARANAVASLVQGRIVVQGKAAYLAAGVRAVNAQAQPGAGVAWQLSIDAAPLFELAGPDAPEYDADKRPFYPYRIAAGARCGGNGLNQQMMGTNFLLRKGQEFIDLSHMLAGSDLAVFSNIGSAYVTARISDGDMQQLRACARSIQAGIDALPYEKIELRSQDALLYTLPRSTSKRSQFEYGLGDAQNLGWLALTPNAKLGAAAQDFTLEAQSVWVMHCDYEGPHIELDNWKQALSAPKAQRLMPDKPADKLLGGLRFAVDLGNITAPQFPAYTPTELRRAIKAHWGEKGLASVAEAKPCAPAERGHRLVLRWRGEVVHEIDVFQPLGC
ncbi:MAG: hypothetical protein ACKVOO_07750 [Burkholderiaceae bacterium]